MYADTAIVRNGFFTHYCHKIRGFMVLRILHPCCPICFQKNPDYTSNNVIHTVIDLQTGSTILAFQDFDTAVKYVQEHPWDTLALDTTGFVK